MSIYDALNSQQLKGVTTTKGPVLILAGAGSGKTSVLTRRIAHLIDEEGVNPWNILAITFTNKAAGEMRERVDDIVGFGSESIWVATFHSTCVRILRRHIDRLGYDTNFTIYDTDDQKSVIKDVCKKLDIDTKKIKERTILGEISSCKDELMSPEDYEMSVYGDFTKRKMAQAYKEYQSSLKKNNALDFDDIIMKTVELFKACPDVLENYQNRFIYIMVDEYQDTNTAQFELIRLLASKNRNLCVVGDDDQSIYKFRGANIRNILDFEKVYPEATVIKLEQNYRSTQNILDAANAVIRNNIGRKSKSLWTEHPQGDLITFKQFDSGYDEANFIASDIKKKKRLSACDYDECAVLYRTNAQSRLLEECFIQENIPYNVVGGVNFYSRKEIKDMLAYLKTIDNGKDDLAVKRIINVPKRGIGATSVSKVQEFADFNEITFFEALEAVDEIPGFGGSKAAQKMKDFVVMIQRFRTISGVSSIENLITDIIETTGFIKEIEESDDEQAEDRIENINELITKAVSFEEEKDELGEEASLSAFLEEVALVADIDNVNSNEKRVLLMTIHSAKGLEFSQVYLAGMEDGMFPSSMTMFGGDPDEMEEERRLAYVAITRAKENLTISCAKARMIRGETQYNPVSRFVKEIPSELLDGSLAKPKKINNWENFDNADFSGFSGFNKISDDIFDKPKKNNWEMPTQTVTKSTPNPVSKPAVKKDISQILVSKPKATPRPKPSTATPDKNKPFIMNGLTKGTPMLSNDGPGYAVGDRVRHIKFGEGEVLEITREPKDYKVTINFDMYGNKIMYAAFAKLQKI